MKVRSSGLTWQVVDGEVVILDLEGSVYLRLNGTGRLLWEQLETTSTMEQLADVLVREFGIEPAVTAADAVAFLDALRARRLIEE